MSKHKGLPCQHTFNKGHKHATLFLLFFFAYAHAKRVRQVSCERVRTVPCACNHLIHCFPVEGHIYDPLKRTAMHYRAISYINLPKTYDEAILAQFVVHHATDSNRTIRVECLRCHHTCQIFKCRFAVG